METMTATRLRQDLYNLLDRVLATGEPLVIERKGRHLIISAEPSHPARSLAEVLERRPDVIVGDPEDLVALDWSDRWEPYL